jgi:hypothetical protein
MWLVNLVLTLAAFALAVPAFVFIAECLLALLLLVSAAFVAGPQDTIAAVLVTLAIVIVASLGVIEPATTAAALPAGSDETQKTAIGSQIPK